MAKEFASFGVPYKIWRDEAKNKNGDLIWDARWIEPGQSYYVGSGGNKASVTPEASAKSIKEERLLRLNKQNTSIQSPSLNTGAQVNQSSTELNDQKRTLDEKAQGSNSIANIIQQSLPNSNNTPPENADDRNAHDKKKGK